MGMQWNLCSRNSEVNFANISNKRIALQHVGYKYVPNIWRLLTGKTS